MTENQGEIYMAKSKTSGKVYIGQANKKGIRQWGSLARWKTHVYEATNSGKDHCRLLNNAIRKYGEADFEITVLCTCDVNELDARETDYIKEHNALAPTGYNLSLGGAHGKDSPETLAKKKLMHLGKKYDAKTKLHISIGQYGNRRTKNTDEELPMFVYAHKTKKGIKYAVRYPTIDGDKLTLITRSYEGEDAFEKAVAKAEELDKQYNSMELINKVKRERLETNKNKRIRNTKLPKHVYPLTKDRRKIGYYIEGLFDVDGKEIARQEFTGQQSNTRNLNDALNFLKKHSNKLDDKEFVFDESKLPRYMTYCEYEGGKGFAIRYPTKNTDDGENKYITKRFVEKSKSMRDKYDLVLKYYEKNKKTIESCS
jgi:hypothetical protein